MTTNRGRVLIVDDDRGVRDVYASYLADEYDVETASSGRVAVDRADGSIDVVLLDRRMPGPPGDEVIDRVRERTDGCAVGMVTAVAPDFDIVELGLDDYVVKPVDREELVTLVEGLLRRREYDELVREYYAVVSKLAALRSEKSAHELDRSEEYADLVSRLEELRPEVTSALDRTIESAGTDTLFYGLATAD